MENLPSRVRLIPGAGGKEVDWEQAWGMEESRRPSTTVESYVLWTYPHQGGEICWVDMPWGEQIHFYQGVSGTRGNSTAQRLTHSVSQTT